MPTPTPWPRTDESSSLKRGRPLAPPDRWRDVIGEYCHDGEWLSVFERDGSLWAARHREAACPTTVDSLTSPSSAGGRTIAVTVEGRTYRWSELPTDFQAQLCVESVRPIPEVISEALRAEPPSDSGSFRASDLVDLIDLEPTLRLDVRYASSNNFLGHPFYAVPRALLQRPVADAVVRAHRGLRAEGFGLVILDAYRPWYVTKAFWEATPVASRWIVADPARGSRHNRGCAVDVTLVDLESGALAGMPSSFDEPTPRACAFYPGGSSLQRWHRALLLQAMEAEGFTVNDYEWWHFDHRDWPHYRIENRSVEWTREAKLWRASDTLPSR
jgi:D-alanyl-D-alanine dipeptidase